MNASLNQFRDLDFHAALHVFEVSSENHVELREEYRCAHANAFLKSEAKTEAGRKADADLITSDLRLKRDIAEVQAARAYHLMIFLRGSAGEAQR